VGDNHPIINARQIV